MARHVLLSADPLVYGADIFCGLGIVGDANRQHQDVQSFERVQVARFLDLRDGRLYRLVPFELDDECGHGRTRFRGIDDFCDLMSSRHFLYSYVMVHGRHERTFDHCSLRLLPVVEKRGPGAIVNGGDVRRDIVSTSGYDVFKECD